jgi:nucleoside-diphosphate-sugar epimerase
MRVFIVGATGYIGSHVARQLLAAGHGVTGFARNERGRAGLEQLGAAVHLGDIDDIGNIARAALAADVTIFSAQLPSLEQEYATVDALLRAYVGTGKTFIFTSGSGVLGQRTDGDWSEDTFAEDDPFVPSKYIVRRRDTELMVRDAARTGIRTMVIRPPMVWGAGYYGAVDRILASIERTGKACYIGRGLNLYTNVHVEDLATLYALAIERGVAGALYHASSGELNYRTIAELVARQQGVETRSVPPQEAVEIWDKFTMLIVLGVCSRTRSPRSRNELGWSPTRVDVFDQISSGALNARTRTQL